MVPVLGHWGHFPPSKVMKGLKRLHGPRDRIQIFGYKWIVLIVNKNLYWFLYFKYLPLMSCRLCNFLRGDGKNIWEKLYLQEFAVKLLGGSSCFLLIIEWILDSYWSIVPVPIWFSRWFKAYWIVANKLRNFCAAREYVLPGHRNHWSEVENLLNV